MREKVLKLLRKYRKKTDRKIAEMLGVTRQLVLYYRQLSHISARVGRGRPALPTHPLNVKLCKFLNCEHPQSTLTDRQLAELLDVSLGSLFNYRQSLGIADSINRKRLYYLKGRPQWQPDGNHTPGPKVRVQLQEDAR